MTRALFIERVLQPTGQHQVTHLVRQREPLPITGPVIEGLRADGEPVPISTTSSCYVEVAA